MVFSLLSSVCTRLWWNAVANLGLDATHCASRAATAHNPHITLCVNVKAAGRIKVFALWQRRGPSLRLKSRDESKLEPVVVDSWPKSERGAKFSPNSGGREE